MLLKKPLIIFFFILSVQLFAQPGKQFELNSISFEGNNTFPSSTLSEVITSQQTPWWFWKFLHSFSSLGKEPVYFDSTNIQMDINSLRDYYNSNGFFEAQFSYKYNIDTSGAKIDLIYIINESKQASFGKLDLVGLKSLPEYIFKSVSGDAEVDTAKRYSQETIQNNTGKAVSNLQNTGYMFARSDSTLVIKDTILNKANTDIYFTTGNRYTIDTILINKTGEGADLVDDELIRDVTGIQEGQFYSNEMLRSSQSRLYRTGIFNSVVVEGDKKDTTDSKVPVLLTGNIGLMNELSPEIILNSQNGHFNSGLGFSYIRKNFLGDARKLTLSSSFALEDLLGDPNIRDIINHFSVHDIVHQGYVDTRITLDQPYIFERPIFGTWETYFTIDKELAYNNEIYGTKFTFDFEMPAYTFISNLSASYTVERSNTNFVTYNNVLSKTFISDIAGDASSTSADNILFPTQGYNLSFHIEEANSLPYLLSKISKSLTIDSLALFYKVVLTGSYYIPLDRSRSSIFATKFKIGNIQIFYGNFSGIPVNRSFYVGGSNSIRGWLPNDTMLVPRGSQQVLGIQGISLKGGTFLMEGSFEFRKRFLENFGLALFTDYGNTWLGYNQFRWDDVAIAAGFGFRYYTPIAPFRLDLGFKFYDPHPVWNDPSKKLFIWQNWDAHFLKNIVFQFGLGEAF